MQPSKQLSILDTISSLTSQLYSLFVVFCLPLLALSGCGGGSASSSFALPSSTSLPSSCTAATIGSDYSCDITVTGGSAPFSWTVSGLPSGFTSNADSDTTSTLTITGTPQAAAAAPIAHPASTRRPAGSSGSTSSVQINVTDSHHHMAHLTFMLSVSPPATLTITTTSLAGGTAGTAYSATVAASGGTQPYTWKITGLPTGLTFSSATPSATISGTTNDSGTFSVMASVTDSAATPATVSATLSLTIAQAAALTFNSVTLPSATDGTSYPSQTLSASGGLQPYAYTVSGGTLPHGMNGAQAGNSFRVSGTPNDVAQIYTITVLAKDSSSPQQSKSATLTLTLAAASPVALTPSNATLPAATANTQYLQTIMASGGIPPYSFMISANSLPATLSIQPGNGAGSGTNAATETISGTPTATETGASVTVEVSDSSLPTPLTHSVTYTLDVNAVAAACAFAGKQIAFELSGSDAAGPGILLGSVSVATDGSLSGVLDFRNQSTLTPNVSISGAAGSCKNGSVANTGMLAFMAGGIARTLDFAIPANFANGAIGHVAEKDSSGFSGAGQLQIQDDPTASLEGSRAFGLEGFAPTVEAFSIGAFCVNAQSSISFLQADFGVSLVEINMIMGTSGTFSAPDSHGRSTTTAAVTYANGTTLNNTVYVVNGHKAFAMVSSGTAPGLGNLPPMAGFFSGVPGTNCLPTGQGGSFSNSSLAPSTFFAHGVSGSGGVINGTGVNIGAILSVNATAGTLAAEFDQNSFGMNGFSGVQTVSFSIPSGNNGRGSITSPAGGINFYLDGNGNAYLIFSNPKSQAVLFGVSRPRSAATIATGTYAFGTQLLVLGAPVLGVTEVQITASTISDLAPGGSTGSYSCDASGRCTAPSLSNNVTFGDTSIAFYVNGNTDSPTTQSEINVIQLTSTTPVGGGLEQ